MVRRRTSTVAVVAAALAAVAAAAPGAAPASAAAPTRPAPFHRPVPGPVHDPYRPPPCRWCPGNRGIDFAANAGDPVAAVADGTIVFAGSVGDDLFVVESVDDLRVTYGYLGEIAVTVGQRVRRAEVIGRAQGPVHVGLRRSTTYLDPAPWFLVQVGHPRLARI
jgi:murein DD-endopeptidase MepM/ murein hydrolase activator NlpD